MPSNFMQDIKTDVSFTLKSGVKVKFFRREPFKFMGDIEKWMNDLNVGEPLAFEMNTDANGWVNLAIAYREYKAPVADPIDPNLVMLDIAGLLKDTVEELHKLKLLSSPAGTLKQEAVGAD